MTTASPAGPLAFVQDPEARAEIARLIDSAYDALSFEEGSAPDWARFNATFHESCSFALRLFPGDAEITLLDLDEYARVQIREDMEREGYAEVPGDREITVFGEVAVALQWFSMHFPDGSVARAMDVFSLAVLGGNWRVIGVVSDVAGPAPGAEDQREA